LPSNHKGQKIKTEIIFKEAIKREVPKNKWENFIIEQLTQPELYVNKKNERKTVKNNILPRMDIINEEEL